MANPWDLPPLPTQGDTNEDQLYMFIGRVVTGWEMIEMELCMAMAAFSGDMAGEGMRQYGKERTTTGRLSAFSEAARLHFIAHPDQVREGGFNSLVDEAQQFSQRRNNVAHSIVREINEIAPYRFKLRDPSTRQWAAIAPYHNVRFHDADGLPEYAFTSKTLSGLLTHFDDLFQRLRVYRKGIPLPSLP